MTTLLLCSVKQGITSVVLCSVKYSIARSGRVWYQWGNKRWGQHYLSTGNTNSDTSILHCIIWVQAKTTTNTNMLNSGCSVYWEIHISKRAILKESSSEKHIIFVIKDLKICRLLAFFLQSFYSRQAEKWSRIAPPWHGLDGTSRHKNAEAEQEHSEAEHKYTEAGNRYDKAGTDYTPWA